MYNKIIVELANIYQRQLKLYIFMMLMLEDLII